MKLLKERTEIAEAINFHRMPVVIIDLKDADEYGLISKPVVIDNGKFRDGLPYYINARVRAYRDENRFEFHAGADCLHASFSYYDLKEMLDYANAPIVKTDSDVVISVIDSANKRAYPPMILHTRKFISPYCSTPLTFVDTDYETIPFLRSAGKI